MIFFVQVSHSQLWDGIWGDQCEEIEKKVKAQSIRRKNPHFLLPEKGKTQFFPTVFLSCKSPSLLTEHTSLLILLVTECEGFPYTKQVSVTPAGCPTINSILTLFLGGIALPRDSTRSCMLRAQSHKSATTLSDASRKPPLLPTLLINQLQMRGSKSPLHGFN